MAFIYLHAHYTQSTGAEAVREHIALCALMMDNSLPFFFLLFSSCVFTCCRVRVCTRVLCLSTGSTNGVRAAWGNCKPDQKNGFVTNALSALGLPEKNSTLSPYQKVLKSLSEDSRWQKEIVLGQRIGFYRFRGEVGSGNFSCVKVGLHTLTKGKRQRHIHNTRGYVQQYI